MKTILKAIVYLSIIVLLITVNAKNAKAAGANMTGPGTVRAGDTITVTLNIADSGKYGLEGMLDYDASKVTLTSAKTGLSGWKLEQNGNSLVLYDDALASPMNGTVAAITFTFKVNGGLTEGTPVNISVSNIVTTDGSSESNIGTATYSVSIARPLSGNANLSSLAVASCNLNPAFSKDTTTYNLGEVDYSVSKLDVTYKTEDANAKVAISGGSLSVGNNTVTITVTAENGSKKSYKINVIRKQDPNYVKSSDASLQSLSVSGGTLSPAFSSDVTDYIVYRPYESIGSAFTATGKAKDGKALGVTEGSIGVLKEGVNALSVKCQAEDGTEKEYKVTVVVMPKYNGAVPDIQGVQVETTTEKPTPEETTNEEETTTVESVADSKENGTDMSDKENDKADSTGISPVILIIAIILALLAGFGICFIMVKKDILKKFLSKEE